MKYRDIKISFDINGVAFEVISISLEKLTKSFPKHSHSKNSYEIHYVPFGYGKTICSETEYRIVPGSIYVTGPGIEHEQQSDSNNPMTEFCIYVQARDRKSDAVKKSLNGNGGTVGGKQEKGKSNEKSGQTFLSTAFWFGMANERISHLMKLIVSELEERQEGCEEVLESLVRLYILATIRLYKSDDAAKNNIQKNGTALGGNTENLTYLIIEEEFLYNYRELTLDSLSSKIGLGRRQTERLLKEHYGSTFQQMKQEARIAAACGMLKDTDMSVAQIAEYLGYSSSEHFSYAFKKIKGITALKFRSGGL